MRRRDLLAAGGALALSAAPARAGGEVDLLLVLAVDVSRSIDEEEARLQREGYRAAMAHPRVIAAITGGPSGAIAVAYLEWAGIQYQRLVIPWTRLADAADCAAWSTALAAAPRDSMAWTSLSGALMFSGRVLADCPFDAARRVIDVSGDGVNNSGPSPEAERDRLVAEGVVINGLPIVNDRPNFGRMPTQELEPYYRERVIGGEGAFLVVADDFDRFGTAIRRKLVTEIAGLGSDKKVFFF
ncbi:MAG: DUF1194 domain-containing protein [Acetobacteraceae bacterium]|nr:DUF1194 domain-containing protein [Acetobacteraceae bacterium]